jgi:hypothetical protein
MTQTQRIQTGDGIITPESRTIFAHSLPGRPQSEWETLEVHTARVAELARSFASAFGAADWGSLLGRWHDLGKRSDKFQEYVRKSGDPDAGEEEGAAGRVDHSTFGAQHAAKTVAASYLEVLRTTCVRKGECK